MTSIDRTIYRRMKRSYTTKELIEAYIPTEEERRFGFYQGPFQPYWLFSLHCSWSVYFLQHNRTEIKHRFSHPFYFKRTLSP
jgi:hypothetical protein